MTNFLIRRIVQSAIVLFFSSVAVFVLLFLAPGGPLSEIIETKRQSSRFPVLQEDIERLKKQYDLDLPLWQSYTRWAFGLPVLADRAPRRGIIRGDFGTSWRISEHEPTLEVVTRVLPNTLKLTISATLLSLIIAVPIGIYSAVHQYSRLDYLVTSGTFLGTSMPVFWLGTMLLIAGGLYLRTFPLGGLAGPKSLILPTLTLASLNAAVGIASSTYTGLNLSLEAVKEFAATLEEQQTLNDDGGPA